jgi:hypothetical protein
MILGNPKEFKKGKNENRYHWSRWNNWYCFAKWIARAA